MYRLVAAVGAVLLSIGSVCVEASPVLQKIKDKMSGGRMLTYEEYQLHEAEMAGKF